jgi:hypothetical protein
VMRGTRGVSDAPSLPASSLSESCVVMSPFPFADHADTLGRARPQNLFALASDSFGTGIFS